MQHLFEEYYGDVHCIKVLLQGMKWLVLESLSTTRKLTAFDSHCKTQNKIHTNDLPQFMWKRQPTPL